MCLYTQTLSCVLSLTSTAEERDKVFQTEAEMFAMAAVETYQLVHNDWNLTSLPS